MNENEERNLNGDITTENIVANTTEYNGEYSTNIIIASKGIDIEAPETQKKKHRGRVENLIGHQWKPGQSGNPKGRPKTPDEVKQKLRDALGEAVDRLIELSKNADKDSVKYQATQDLIDRVLGKPTQPLDIDQTNAVRVEFVGGTDDLAK